MKSKHTLVVMGLLFLVLAVSASVGIWADVSTPVKLGMFVYGFGSGVAVGGWFAAGNRKSD
ncbi:MAG: hypothetical protein IH588_19940 [Anaerolineales bacterium]|nr:hypothetical protein [Anaerolineales bacterium]